MACAGIRAVPGIISVGRGGGDWGMRCKKFFAVVSVVVPRAQDAVWQSCTTTACNRISCIGIRSVTSDGLCAIFAAPISVRMVESVPT